MLSPHIEARDVTAGYLRRDVLRGISLALQPGEFVGLIGPNGAGKSTLLRVLSGSLPTRSGSVLVDGSPISSLSARQIARRIAFVPQAEPALFDFTVRDVVLMGRHPFVSGIAGEKSEDFAAAVRAMAATDTLQLADRPVTALSGGEHRRVLMARALAQSAPALLLDEPTAHLDVSHQVDVLTVVRQLVDRDSAAALAALHDLNLAAGFCDRVILLADGRAVSEGRPEAVLTHNGLSQVYGAGIHVTRDPTSGMPVVLPALPPPNVDTVSAPRVHVICGGGTGAAALSELQRRGFWVTAGVLNRLDSDEDACEALGIRHVAEAPFSPIGPEARSACAELIACADAVLVTDLPIGRGNLANLELAGDALAAGKRVFLMGGRELGERDFTGGAATAIWEALVRKGAVPESSVRTLEWLLAGPEETRPTNTAS